MCRAIVPKLENCEFYPSAAAAMAQGFRPCKRCRPESAPGSPAWNGAATTVSRAMRLIREGGLDDGNTDAFASRLGVSARHLRRLFQQHLGASPGAVARAQRVLFAVKLIQETELPFGQIAYSAGFGSVRRFNAAIAALYGSPPSALRRDGARVSAQGGDCVRLKLDYAAPYDWDFMRDFFAARALPGVEVVSDDSYQRTIRVGDVCGWLRVAQVPERQQLRIDLQLPDTHDLHSVVWRVRRLFDLDADRAQIDEQLAQDALLAPLVAHQPGLSVPGAWDLFEITVRAIIGQQISVAAARTIAGRLVALCGDTLPGANAAPLTHVFPRAVAVANADLSGLGLTKKRAENLQAVAQAFADDQVGLRPNDELQDMERTLCRLPGIGPWTAQYIAMRALDAADAFPVGDLGLRHGLAALGHSCTSAEMQTRAEHWRPFRAYAAVRLWAHLAQNRS